MAVLVLEAGVGALARLYEEQVGPELKMNLNRTFLENYSVRSRETAAIDQMQKEVSAPIRQNLLSTSQTNDTIIVHMRPIVVESTIERIRENTIRQLNVLKVLAKKTRTGLHNRYRLAVCSVYLLRLFITYYYLFIPFIYYVRNIGKGFTKYSF